MSILFFRVFNHVIRTLARPIINWIMFYNKNYLKQNKNTSRLVHITIICLSSLGQIVNKTNLRINKKVFNLQSIDINKPLPDDRALEKGFEYFSEAVIYMFLLSIPIYEYIRITRESNQKIIDKQNKIAYLQEEIRFITNKNDRVIKQIKELEEAINKDLKL